MFRNYFKAAFRNLTKKKGLSFINFFGLATGIACSLLIILFVTDELSYDRFNANPDRIYRVVKDFVNDDGSRLPDATTPPALAPAMQQNIPEVEHATRLFPGWGNKYLLSYRDKKFLEDKLFRVDSSFFTVFTFPFVKGSASTAFRQTDIILITESMAKKYFGNEDPMGKVIHTDNLGDLMVTGILKDVPSNSHFHFDFLISIRKFSGNIDNQWGWYNFYTYVKLKPNAQIATVDPKIRLLYKKNSPDGKNVFYSQALTDIHLTSDLKWEIEPNSHKLYVYVFSVIALFVIIIASINYVNLTTAKSAIRAKEIGVRKVAGAFTSTLVKQFLTESVVTVMASFLLSLFIAQALLPFVNQLTQKQLSLATLLHPGWVLTILTSVIAIGLLAGAYPALYLSSFKPALVLKGIHHPEKNVFTLRKALVVLQFTISVALIIGTLIVIEQIRYIQSASLGLNKDQVLIVNNAGSFSRSGRETLLQAVSQIHGVKGAATANGVIGGQNWTTSMKSKGSQNGQLINFLGISYNYLNVLGIHIMEGRNFSSQFPADTTGQGVSGTTERISGSVILNQRAIKDLGVPSPAVGRLVSWGTDHDTTFYLKIVGVAQDFHFASFKCEIKPFAFFINNDWQDNFTIKLSASDITLTISEIEKKWKIFLPDRPFQYSFLDETFANLYKSEQRFNEVFLFLTVLAIVIACLGLFGLTAFMVEKRTKEIGIRKVIGASVTNIIILLSKDFIALVVVGFVIASPVALYFMNKWLQGFAYRVDIDWRIFLLSGLLALVIAFVTVSFQAIRAAVANPVKSLKTE
jgi:putative ABC transport system permease protein